VIRLPSERLDRLRAIQVTALPETCTVIRSGTATSDGRGGSTSTRSVVATVPCRVAGSQYQGGGGENTTESRLLSENTFTVTMAYGTDVRSGDRVSFDGRTLEVTGRDGDLAWGTAVRLACVERVP
jgi:head-tail adaptor